MCTHAHAHTLPRAHICTRTEPWRGGAPNPAGSAAQGWPKPSKDEGGGPAAGGAALANCRGGGLAGGAALANGCSCGLAHGGGFASGCSCALAIGDGPGTGGGLRRTSQWRQPPELAAATRRGAVTRRARNLPCWGGGAERKMPPVLGHISLPRPDRQVRGDALWPAPPPGRKSRGMSALLRDDGLCCSPSGVHAACGMSAAWDATAQQGRGDGRRVRGNWATRCSCGQRALPCTSTQFGFFSIKLLSWEVIPIGGTSDVPLISEVDQRSEYQGLSEVPLWAYQRCLWCASDIRGQPEVRAPARGTSEVPLIQPRVPVLSGRRVGGDRVGGMLGCHLA